MTEKKKNIRKIEWNKSQNLYNSDVDVDLVLTKIVTM